MLKPILLKTDCMATFALRKDYEITLASDGVIYISAEYPYLRERLNGRIAVDYDLGYIDIQSRVYVIFRSNFINK